MSLITLVMNGHHMAYQFQGNYFKTCNLDRYWDDRIFRTNSNIVLFTLSVLLDYVTSHATIFITEEGEYMIVSRNLNEYKVNIASSREALAQKIKYIEPLSIPDITAASSTMGFSYMKLDSAYEHSDVHRINEIRNSKTNLTITEILPLKEPIQPAIF